MYRRAYGHAMCWCPQNSQEKGIPPNCQHKGKSLYDIQISPNIPMHREANKWVGAVTEVEANPYRGRCPTCKGAPHNPQNMQKPLKTYRCTEEYGDMWGVHPWGVQMYEVYTCTGVYKQRGHPDTSPSIKNMPASKRSGKTLLKAKFLHLKNWKID